MFDETKFQVGKLCKRGHKFEGAGNSLRYIIGRSCVLCAKKTKTDYRKTINGKNKKNDWSKKTSSKIKRNKYRRIKYREDVNFKLSITLRSAMSRLARTWKIKKIEHSLELLGCSIKFWRKHLHSTFTNGMTWKKLMNGEIHIDHKIPLCAFDLSDINQQKIAFNWRNTQCLWSEDNLKKLSEDIKLDWRNWK